MKILLTIGLCYFTIKIPISSFKLEAYFLMFAIFLFLYSVFFEEEDDEEKVHKHATILTGLAVTTYTCLFLYFTDISVLEVLALVVFVLSYPANYFYSKSNYPKIKIGNKN